MTHDPEQGSTACATIATTPRTVEACADYAGRVWRCGGPAAPDTSPNPAALTRSTSCDGRRFAPVDAVCSTPGSGPGPKAGCLFGTGPNLILATCTLDAGAPVDCTVTDDVCLAPLVDADSGQPPAIRGRSLQGSGSQAQGVTTTLLAHALAIVLQNLHINPGGSTLPPLAACPTPQPTTGSNTVGGAFEQAAGVAQLVGANGEPIATFVDGVTETDPSGPGNASAIPGNALDLLVAALGPAAAQQPGPVVLVVTQANPQQLLTYDPATGVWTVGSARARNPATYRLAAVIRRVAAQHPELLRELMRLAGLRWTKEMNLGGTFPATSYGIGLAALMNVGRGLSLEALRTLITDAGIEDGWMAEPLLAISREYSDVRFLAFVERLLLRQPANSSGSALENAASEQRNRPWSEALKEIEVAVAGVLVGPGGPAARDPNSDVRKLVHRAFAPWADGPPGG